MRVYGRFELPPEKARLHVRAVRLEWWTIVFFVVAIMLLAVTLGQSQAMKAAWIEDMLGLVPPAAFLVAARFRNRQPTGRFPYGYHRSVSVAFLAGSVALLSLGGYVVYDPVIRLIADAEMNRADWLTAGAAVLGILGIGAGLWWADAVAALIIGADIVRDGIRTTRAAVADLMDEAPSLVDGSGPHPLPRELLAAVRDHDWVADAWLRLREEGHVFVGELLVVPRPDVDRLTERVEALAQFARDFNWRVHDLVVAPVTAIETPDQGAIRGSDRLEIHSSSGLR